MTSRDANLRQLEIWKKTLHYEIEMMEPLSTTACVAFVDRLLLFEKQLKEDGEKKSVVAIDT